MRTPKAPKPKAPKPKAPKPKAPKPYNLLGLSHLPSELFRPARVSALVVSIDLGMKLES